MPKFIVQTVRCGDTELTIKGHNHWNRVYTGKPEWSEREEEYFMFQGDKQWLSEFVRPPTQLNKYHGIKSDSYFSGILIIMSDDGEAVKPFIYFS